MEISKSVAPTTSVTNMTAVKAVDDSSSAADVTSDVPVPNIQALMHKEKYELSISEEAVVKAVERANKAIQGVDKRFEYSVHQKTGEIIVKVLNKETNEVIREIPPEKLIDLVAKLQEICGMIIDEKR